MNVAAANCPEALLTLLARLGAVDSLYARGGELLRRGLPDDRAHLLDAQYALLHRHLQNLTSAWQALAGADQRPLCELTVAGVTSALTTLAPVVDRLDRLGDALLLAWRGEPPLSLLAAFARLLEDVPRLSGRSRPFGNGFEDLLDERRRRRNEVLRRDLPLLLSAEQHQRQLMEDPAGGRLALEEARQEALTEDERTWLDVERRVTILRFVRRGKADGEGHIRWFVRRDPAEGPVLDAYGLEGHWLVPVAEAARTLRRLRLAEGVGSRAVEGWQVVPSLAIERLTWEIVDSAQLAERLPAPVPAEPSTAGAAELTATDGHLELRWRHGKASGVVASVSLDEPAAGELPNFLDSLERVADLGLPVDRIENDPGGKHSGEAVRAARRLLRDRTISEDGAASVRLVYIPSSLPHPLGGVPRVGSAFLADHLERQGVRADEMILSPQRLEAQPEETLAELFGADVVGIGVYVHNRREVAELVRRLRERGYRGRIVLGGPEVRDVDAILAEFDGWDALVRGEAEEVLPKVLAVLADFAAGRWRQGLEQARGLRGVALRLPGEGGGQLLLCDVAARNRAEVIRCPLPLGWRRGPSRRLKMNFTRGCPYRCVFCPNHQGTKFRAGPLEELWRYAVLAVADQLPLPPALEDALARTFTEILGLANPLSFETALHLFLGSRSPREHPAQERFEQLLAVAADFVHPELLSEPDRLDELLGVRETAAEALAEMRSNGSSRWQRRRFWLLLKVALLAERQRRALPAGDQQPFILETSEDNTLVNRDVVLGFLERRRRYGLAGDFLFNPGQNTIRDLMKGREADEEFIRALVQDNPFAVAFGADGTSNAVLRQNGKPVYGVTGLLSVNRALARHGVEVANNYILLTPETNLLEAVEAFLLWLLLPVPWRDYGDSINLRVIREDGTLSTDQALLTTPPEADADFDVPLQDPSLDALLRRWDLTSRLPSRHLRARLWQILSDDPQATALLPRVIERWEQDYDDDPECVALARLVRSRETPRRSLLETLQALEAEIHHPTDGALSADRRTRRTFREMPEPHQQKAAETADRSLPTS